MLGGPCAYNPEPLADFADIVVLGEAEEVLLEIIERYRIWKGTSGSRRDFLVSISSIEGVYIPSLYRVKYDGNGRISDFSPVDNQFPRRITKRFIRS